MRIGEAHALRQLLRLLDIAFEAADDKYLTLMAMNIMALIDGHFETLDSTAKASDAAAYAHDDRIPRCAGGSERTRHARTDGGWRGCGRSTTMRCALRRMR